MDLKCALYRCDLGKHNYQIRFKIDLTFRWEFKHIQSYKPHLLIIVSNKYTCNFAHCTSHFCYHQLHLLNHKQTECPSDAEALPTLGSGGNRALLRRYMFPTFIWMLVLVKRSSWKLGELSRGQMSLSPAKGEIVMVFFNSDCGRLSLIPPST